MALDPRFVLLAPLQEQLVEKTTGAPLSGGIVTFYQDENRSILKPVYQLSGSPPYSAASFVELNNPIQLTSIGTFADNNGDDIVPYLFPYEGTPTDSSGEVELYYITVVSSTGSAQFTREAWPSGIAASPEPVEDNSENFVPNGQFLLHNEESQITETSTTARTVSTDITYVAQGGWTFEIPTSSDPNQNTYTVSFITLPFPNTDPNVSGNPKYAINIVGNTGVSNSFVDLCLKFPNVNKFASPDQLYTYGFQGYATGSDVPVSLLVGYNFGTGTNSPSAYYEQTINSWVIPANSQNLVVRSSDGILFSQNDASIIGTNNDDFVKLIIRFPSEAGQSFTVTMTSFCMFKGDVLIDSFPVTTDAEFLDASTAGWLPTPAADGSNLYLPIVLTQTGFNYDSGDIGKIIANASPNDSAAISTTTNELLCNGASYAVDGYSPLGIPYSRLWNKIWNSTNQVPAYGTGDSYSIAYINSGNTAQLILCTNKFGAVTAPSNGSPSPTFTYRALKAGVSSPGYGYRAFTNTSGVVTCITNGTGAVLAAPSAGTSTMSLTDITDSGVSGINQVFAIDAVAASVFNVNPGTMATALYFDFSSSSTSYRMWFKVVDQQPPAADGRTLVEVDLDSTMAAEDVAYVIAAAMSGQQVDLITCVALTAPIPAGSYFTFQTNFGSVSNYSPWYSVNGSGSEPAVTNPIEVELETGDLAADVASKTQAAINSQFFAVPDLRGVSLMGADVPLTPIWDVDQGFRYGDVGLFGASSVGSFQTSANIKHNHPGSLVTGNNATGGNQFVTTEASSQVIDQGLNITTDGNGTSRPVNMYVNWFIKY